MAATPSYGRVGLTFIGDLSGDGKPELIIPQEDKIHVYTYGIKAGDSQNFRILLDKKFRHTDQKSEMYLLIESVILLLSETESTTGPVPVFGIDEK